MARTKRGLSSGSAALGQQGIRSTLKRRKGETTTGDSSNEAFPRSRRSTVQGSGEKEERQGGDGDGDGDDDESEDPGDEASETRDDEEDAPGPLINEAIEVEQLDDYAEDVEPKGRGLFGFNGTVQYPQYTEGKITGLRLCANQSFSDDEYGTFNFRMFGRKYAKLRHLTHIWLWGVDGREVDEYNLDIPYRAAKKLTHLKVTTSNMDSDILTRMIGFSDNCLKSFTYHTGGLESPEWADKGLANMSPGDIWAILDGSSPTLEKLDVDFDSQLEWMEGRYWDTESDRKDEVFAAIKVVRKRIRECGQWPEFPNLKCLRIGIQALMGLVMPPGSGRLSISDGLPKGLEELTIRGYDANVASEDYVQQVEKLLDDLPTKLPKLTKLEGVDECIRNGRDVETDPNRDNPEGEVDWLDWSDNSDGY